MIVVKLMGGIGNQMFQYATGRRVAKVNGTKLNLDTTNFDKNYPNTTSRNFLLKNFNINANIASKKEIRYFKKYKKIHIRILGHIYNTLFANDLIYITEKSYGFNPEILNLKDNIYLDGYWQSEKYFKDIRNILLQEFTTKNKNEKYLMMLEKIETISAVSLHIRRGDYISNKKLVENYGVCNLDYYNKAIALITEKLKNPHFFIFSDDINWAKNNLKIKHEHVFVSGTNLESHEELVLMSKCKHNIIANSSFSWWGAWLNENQGKIVIAPKKWFKNESWIPKDIIPETWITL